MGTETKIDIDILQLYGIHLVKLNNPQMGTETDELFHNVSSVIKYS